MIAEAVRRSPLATYPEKFSALGEASHGDAVIRERPFLTQFNLRLDPKDQRALQNLRAAIGFELPLAPNTTASGDRYRALWLGPDEWLIVGPDGQTGPFEQALHAGVAGTFASIVDVSASRTVLQISGARARDLLSRSVPIDLDPRAFQAGRCAQTLIAKGQVIIERRNDDEVFHLYVRASFAGYVADWLLDAASNYLRETREVKTPPVIFG